MKLKKLYTYTNKKQIWRLLPTDTGKIVIEERDAGSKQVFFNCINMSSGKTLLSNFQFDEKYWIGIEAVIGDLIIFHRFVKPDLPNHNGIIVFDILSQSILWQTTGYNFLFTDQHKLYAYRSRFEGKEFFVLNLFTGEEIDALGDNSEAVNILKQTSSSEAYFKDFRFPSPYSLDPVSIHAEIFNKLKDLHTITGKIDFLEYEDFLLINFHEVQKDGTLMNTFLAIDIKTKRVILEEILNSASKTMMPDSFFMVNDYLLLLKEKTKLIVCRATD